MASAISAWELDLERVAVPDRARLWGKWVPEAFPGLKVVRLATRSPIGIARRIPFGIASIWTIIVASQSLRHEGLPRNAAHATVVVLFHHEGRTEVAQNGRICQLRRGDLCVIDGSHTFEMKNFGVGSVTLLQIPHAVAAARIPGLVKHSAQTVSGESSEVVLLHSLIGEVVRLIGGLHGSSTPSILDAILLMLASLPVPNNRSASALHWRVRTALRDIDRMLDEPALSADTLASRQGISRRRLDALFTEHLGTTCAAQILERRLAECAASLCDFTKRHLSMASIAGAAGFISAAHFSRCFKLRFGSTPREWRRLHAPPAR